MAATVAWNEYNGAGETKTAGISNINAGSVDAPNLVIADNPIQRETNAFEKFHKVEFGGTFNRISNMKVWRSDNAGGDGAALPTDVSLIGEIDATYSAPAAADAVLSAMPSAEGSALSLGPTEITSAGETNYIHTQLQIGAGTPTGEDNYYLTIRYDEE